MWRTEAGATAGRDGDTWKPQTLSHGIPAASVELDLPSRLRALCNARTARKIFASHLGKFLRNPDRPRGVFFLFLIPVSPPCL